MFSELTVIRRSAELPPPRQGMRQGWLLKKSGAHQPSAFALAAVGTAAQTFFWRWHYFVLEAEQLVYYVAPPDAGQPCGAFLLADVDEVTVKGRSLALHFRVPQLLGSRRCTCQQLWLSASSGLEAEGWGAAVRKAVAGLRTDLPSEWDVDAMLQGGVGKVRLVAKKSLPEGSVTAMQRLVDHAFIWKTTRDRKGRDMPLRLQVVAVEAVQNIAAWTEYTKSRERLAAAACRAPRLEPDVRTASVGDPLVAELLGEVCEEANERWLFHGSTFTAVQGIADSEFRIDLAGSHRGTMYGKGVYLAECSSKADEYSELGKDRLCCMLLCRSALGRILVDRSKNPESSDIMEHCQSGHDSVCGDRWAAVGTYREFVLYESNQVYPAYVIRYRRVWLKSFLNSIIHLEEQSRRDKAAGSEDGASEAAVQLILCAAKLAEGHPNMQVRASVPVVLARHAAGAVPCIIACLRDESRGIPVRKTAALALGMLGARDGVVLALTEFLDDSCEHLRRASAAALGRLGESAVSAVPGLRAHLQDENANVRCCAANALAQVGLHVDVAVKALADSLVDQPTARPLVAAALGILDERARPALPGLISCLNDESGETRFAAARVLGQLGARHAQAAVPALTERLGDVREDVRAVAAEALGRIGAQLPQTERAVALRLVELLLDQSPRVRSAAAESLGQLTSDVSDLALPALMICFLRERSPGVSTAVRVAIEKHRSRARRMKVDETSIESTEADWQKESEQKPHAKALGEQAESSTKQEGAERRDRKDGHAGFRPRKVQGRAKRGEKGKDDAHEEEKLSEKEDLLRPPASRPCGPLLLPLQQRPPTPQGGCRGGPLPPAPAGTEEDPRPPPAFWPCGPPLVPPWQRPPPPPPPGEPQAMGPAGAEAEEDLPPPASRPCGPLLVAPQQRPPSPQQQPPALAAEGPAAAPPPAPPPASRPCPQLLPRGG